MLLRFLAHLTGQAGGCSERQKTLEEHRSGLKEGSGAHELGFGHAEFEESSRQLENKSGSSETSQPLPSPGPKE